MIPPLLLILPILFLGSILSVIAGGGLGTLLIIATTFFTDIRTSVVLISMLGFVIQSGKIAHFYRYTRWDIVQWYVLLGVPMSFLGALFLFIVPLRFLEIAIGLSCILFVLADLRPSRVRAVPRRGKLIAIGAVNGLIGGIIGQSSIMRISMLLSFGLSKEAFVGTSSVIAILMNIGKTSVYVWQFSWSRDVIFLLVVSVPVVMVGLSIGKRLLRYVSPILFERLLQGIILIGGIRLIFFP